MWLPEAHYDLIQKEILRTNNFFESRLLGEIKSLVKKDSIVVDAGANIGNHTIFFSKICEAGQVLSFEPQVSRFKILLKNIYLNELVGVQSFRCALGERSGFASISGFKPWNSGGTSFSESDNGMYVIKSLDSFNLPKLDLIKIDVEGFQDSLIRGSTQTFLRCKPLIIVEIRDSEEEFIKTKSILEQLNYSQAKKLSSTDYLFVPL